MRGRYSRIHGDPRHRDVSVLSMDRPNDRLFGQWARCARTLSAADAAIAKTLTAKGGFHPVRTGAPGMLKLLMAVRDIKTRMGAPKAA